MSHLAVLRDASLEPAQDIVLADVAREATNEHVGRIQPAVEGCNGIGHG